MAMNHSFDGTPALSGASAAVGSDRAPRPPLGHAQPLVVALALVLLLPVVLMAQQQVGGLYGRVTAPEEMPLPGASVTLEGMGAPRLQTADTQGRFRFLGLDPGLYGLTAGLDGFSTVEHSGIDIRAGRNTTMDVRLSPAIDEIISVTGEAPLLDERKLAQGTIVKRVELDAIPTARDPWALLNQAPGVLIDRINVGGNESGNHPTYIAPTAERKDNQYVLDGIEITDLTYIGGTHSYYDFDQFTQVELSTGGSEISKLTPGVTINMVTKRGTNELRGSARYLLTDPDGYLGVLKQAEPNIDPNDLAPGQSSENLVGNQVDGVEDYGFELGGPAWRDRVWLWGSWARTDILGVTIDGQSDPTYLENMALKVNAQISAANSFVGSANASWKEKPARGIGENTEWEAAWNQGQDASPIFKLEDTHIFTSSLFLTGTYSRHNMAFWLRGNGGIGPEASEALLDSDGVWKQNYLGFRSDRAWDEARIEGSQFLNVGESSHELKFGARFRDYSTASSQWTWPGRQLLHMASEVWGRPPGPIDYLMAARSDMISTSQQYLSAWLQDTVAFGSWTLNGGLRYDLQEGENNPANVGVNPAFPELMPAVEFEGNDGGGFDWETVNPRLGVTYAVGEDRRTLLRASYARFAQQLDSWTLSRLSPLVGAYAYASFEDGNDNNMWDDAEIDGEPVFFYFENLDPETSHQTDPNLAPEITDEIVLGLEHAFRSELVTGLTLNWRNVRDVADSLDMVRDQETGQVRLATRDDYFLEQTLEGERPDGSPYSADFYALRPGLEWTGGSYLTNDDREKRYTGATLSLTRRLANRWMARGYLNYGEATWRVPDSFSFYDDPTADADGSDQDGELYMERGKRGEVLLQSDWAFNVNGMYQVAPDRRWGFNVAGNIYARHGYPLPYYVRASSRADGASREAAVGRSDDFRTRDVYTVDLRLEKEFAVTSPLRMTVGLDAFNVLNDNFVLRRRLRLNHPRADYLNETLAPRIFRLGMRLNWR